MNALENSFIHPSKLQFLEVPFDSQMNRTRNRVLVRGLLSPKHALVNIKLFFQKFQFSVYTENFQGFATITAISGTIILVSFSNTLAASLGLLNLFLYTW
jgi:protoheme IX farnesyltransferase